MKRSGFSMIELVFVIVILGVLAAVAVPRFVTTRTDAQVAMARSDIASTLKAIPARVFAENLDPTASTPTGFSSWGEWMIDTGGLDRGRWQVGGNGANGNNGIQPIGNVTQNGGSTNTTGGCGAVIVLDTTTGNLQFKPENINLSNHGNAGTFCKALKESYPSGSNRIIPLATTGAVKF
ncbi:type II secretion system protein [Helicobacter sp. MIT 99-5507]|uniref:type II secretion system protein n=1 Tax=Helicobacter sp. MIT 99-5507 TaxID=152489 RepID=UPI000E1E4A04|nr:prepilin-type N-terminal cleavage/methylation domain-containing protein [Helicobacter sp. MIT 99-5507]RDU58653.1 hypothetical protein CQA42_02430 [Helicobacter sp. MIT 99-5507]